MRELIQRLDLLDQQWSGRLRVDDHPLGRALAVVGAHLGDGPAWLALWLGGVLIFTPPTRWRVLTWLLVSLVAAVATYTIKFSLRRPRPHEIDGFYSKGYDRHAFPSGHATRMGTLPVMGAWAFPQFALLFWTISLICIWARAALGIHFLGDVIAGWIIGAVVSLAAIVVVGSYF